MREVSQELLYALNLPLPPTYTLNQDRTTAYKVPDYFGYENASTRWIITVLTNAQSLKRLIKSGKNYENIFARYYQIPDRPVDLIGNDSPLETPAYHQQSILYLTPLALALYMKQVTTCEMLLSMKNEAGRKIVHVAEACFVQRVFKKGDNRMTNELNNTFPIIIAIRRNFYEGISLLLENGFSPQKQFSILHRKTFREKVTLFRDVIDYVVQLLRHKPGLNASKIVKIILNPVYGLSKFDPFVYDIELDDLNNWDYVSVFRRICRIGFGTKYFIEESSTQVLNVLEQIQAAGYFLGLDQLHTFHNGPMPPAFDRALSTEVLTELQSDKISLVMDKIPTIIKATRDDLFNLEEIELKERVNYDYQCCIGILFLWFQQCLAQERCYHYAKLAFLLTKAILDTKIVEDFFVQTDKELAIIFTEWAQDYIKTATVLNFRIKLQDHILFTDHLCVAFINMYGQSPFMLINAPMMHGKHPENSPVVHDLIVMASSNCEVSVEKYDTNQSNENMNPLILNVSNAGTNMSMNFIPANHAKHFALENRFTMDLNKRLRQMSFNNPSQQVNAELNNSLESLNHSFINEGKSNLPYPPGNCETVINIKSPNELRPEPSNVMDMTNIELSIPMTDILFRPKMPKGFQKVTPKGSRKSTGSKGSMSKRQMKGGSDVPAEELRERLKKLMQTNEKYREVKFTYSAEKVPLKFLRPQIQKYKSVERIIKLIQAKQETQLECLYNNLDAESILEIMQRLSLHTAKHNEKPMNNDHAQGFQYKI